MNQIVPYVVPALRTLTEIFTAAAAMTAFSLLLFSLQFLRKRQKLAWAFVPLLICLVAIYSAEALESMTQTFANRMTWQKIHWSGFIFLPTAFFYFSIALLSMTGENANKKGLVFSILSLLASCLFAVFLWRDMLFDGLKQIDEIGTTMAQNGLTRAFWGFFLVMVVLTFFVFWRSWKRTTTRTGKRRMTYLITGSAVILLGTFPLLLFGSGLAIAGHPLVFWGLSMLAAIAVTGMIFLTGYSVTTFSVSWSDRSTRLRMIEWMLRGPFTAGVTLGLVTLINRGSGLFGLNPNGLNTLATVVSIICLEYLISFLMPHFERNSITGYGAEDYEIYNRLSGMMVFRSELDTYLEALLSALCDKFQMSGGFIVVMDAQGNPGKPICIGTHKANISEAALQRFHESDALLYCDEETSVFAIYENEIDGFLLGMIGLCGIVPGEWSPEDEEIIFDVFQKVREVLHQRHFFTMSRTDLQKESVDMFRQGNVLNEGALLESESDTETIAGQLRDALSHYWGGPKLSESPLINLKSVQQEVIAGADSPVNGLRSVLRKALERIRPSGERSYNSNEWMLYNILEMKYFGKEKAKDVARRLSVSEADLYRKQKVALEMVSKELIQMEADITETEQHE